MKKSTGIWLTLATLAAGAAIGSMCSSSKCTCEKCKTDGHLCPKDMHSTGKGEKIAELKAELADQIDRLKHKLSTLL